MCKKCSTQHKMYAGEIDVQKVLYTAQNVHVSCTITLFCCLLEIDKNYLHKFNIFHAYLYFMTNSEITQIAIELSLFTVADSLHPWYSFLL